MTFEEFSKVNRERCISETGFNHTLASWSLSDWFTALMGESGEAANIAKKLNRIRDDIPGNREDEDLPALRTKLKKELADVFIYLDLLVQSEGFDLAEIVKEKFNETSLKNGFPFLCGS